jgi:hypothetical protein
MQAGVYASRTGQYQCAVTLRIGTERYSHLTDIIYLFILNLSVTHPRGASQSIYLQNTPSCNSAINNLQSSVVSTSI